MRILNFWIRDFGRGRWGGLTALTDTANAVQVCVKASSHGTLACNFGFLPQYF